MGRFVTEDSVWGSAGDPLSLNLYTYCGSNPINFWDPTGHTEEDHEKFGDDSLKTRILDTLGQLWTQFPEARDKLHETADKIREMDIDERSYNKAINQLYDEGIFDKNYDFRRDICDNVSKEQFIMSYIAYSKMSDKFQKSYDGTMPVEVNVGDYFNIEMICFVKGTLIATKNGEKEIQDIQIGDEVYSQDTKTGVKGLKKVVHLFRNTTDTIVHIKIGDTEIDATPTHPFWVEDIEWVMAKDLRIGDRLVLLSGETREIINITIEQLQNPVTTYNFEVEDWHTYYVSEINVWVHNRCLTNGEARQIAAENGWKEVNGIRVMGSLVFTDGKRYYSADRTGHGRTVWKIAESAADLYKGKYDSADEDLNVVRSRK